MSANRTKLWLRKWQIRGKSPQTRLKAVKALREMDNKGVVEVLMLAAQDEDPEVRREAALALGDESDDRVVVALIRALNDPVEAVQEAAIKSLRRQGGAEAVDALVNVFFNGTPAAKWFAAQALEVLRWSPQSTEEKIQWHLARGEYVQLPAFGAAAVTPLAEAMKTCPHEMRVAVVSALETIGGDLVRQPLIEACLDPHGPVRTAAANALARSSGPQIVPALVHLLRDSELNTRVAAVNSLGKLGDAQAVEPLLQLLQDNNWQTRVAVLEALGRLGDPRAFQPVAALMNDKDQEVRRWAIESMGHLGNETIVEKLLLTVVDENRAAREAAVRALNTLRPGWEKSEQVQRLLPQLQANLRDRDSNVQFAAANLFQRISGTVATESMSMTQSPAAPAAEPLPVRTAAILRGLLRDPDPEVRLAALEAIARLRLVNCAEWLKPALNDEQADVRSAASRALAALEATETPRPTGGTPPEASAAQSGLETMLIFSASGDVLDQWQCHDFPRLVSLIELAGDRSQRLATGLSLGEFDRLEAQGESGRLVVVFTADGGVLVRTGKAKAPGVAESAPPGAFQPVVMSEEAKNGMLDWLRRAPSTRGVLVRGVRFSDRTIMCDVESRDFSTVALEQAFGSMADVFQTLGALSLPPLRLTWRFTRTTIHLGRRPDGTILGAFTPARGVPVDYAGLDNLLAEFRRL